MKVVAAVKGAVQTIKGAVNNAVNNAVTEASNEATKEATVFLVKHILPVAIHETLLQGTVAGKPVDSIAGGAGRKAARAVGEKLAHAAVQAIKSAEQAIETALPVSGGVAYEPPITLYTETYECNRPTPGTFWTQLQEATPIVIMGDKVVDLYAQLVDRSKFEDELCGGDKDEAVKLSHLLEMIPEVVKRNTGSAVEVAEMLRGKPGVGKMRDAMYDAAIHGGGPVVGWTGTYEKSAEDLRNLEVVVRLLSQTTSNERMTEEEKKLVSLVREKTWSAVVGFNKDWSAIVKRGPLDMTRFGSRYGSVPLAVLREHTVRLIPDPVPQASAVVNFGLGEWGLLESLRGLVKFAAERFKLSDPEKAAKLAAYAERGQSLGQELLGMYVVRQHVGFEEPGTGYALAVATGTLRALPRTSVYAHATRCLLVYIRALLLPTDDNEKIDGVVAGLPMPKKEAGPRPYELPDVPLACRGVPVGHDARTRRLVRDVCAKNGELVEKGEAMEWLITTFGEGAIPDVNAAMVDAMFEMHDALGALAITKVGGAVAASVAKTLADMQKVELTVGQRRRLEVMQTRVKEASGKGGVDESGAEMYYAHIAAQAKDGKPHGLTAHEFGVAHTAFYVGPTVVYRAPLVEEAPAHGSWMGSLLALMVPSLQSVVDAASDAASGRKVQYRGGEPPGVGYALYALLPVLDHASVMGYGAVKERTLMAVKCLLRAK